MKYKNRLKSLAAAQKWFDNLPQKDQAGLTRPGSVKQRTGTTA